MSEYYILWSSYTVNAFFVFQFKMAAAEDLRHALTKFIECAVCQEELLNARSLPCLHSFCLACLEQWAKTRKRLDCPLCRRAFKTPIGGLSHLPTSNVVSGLIPVVSELQTTEASADVPLVVRQSLAELTECAICGGGFVDPVSLPCLHSCCVECIERWTLYDDISKYGIRCPHCSARFFAPNNNVTEFLRDYKITELTRLADSLGRWLPQSTDDHSKFSCLYDLSINYKEPFYS